MNHLRFADDIAPVNEGIKVLEEMANDLRKESSRVGLEINPKKTTRNS